MPHRKHYLFVCTNRRDADHPKGSCAAKGSEELLLALKAELSKRGLAKDVRACGSTCLDLCEAGAAVVHEPAHLVYAGVTLRDVPALVDALARQETYVPLSAVAGTTEASGTSS
jgi:(2Fe-2S) ferredoxin